MVAGCGPKIAKLFLFIFNVCIWGVGIILISVGSYVTAKQQEYTDLFSEDVILIVTGMTIGVGCFAFIVGFCGCCGAMKEGTCLLKTYWFLMLLIICMEITAGVLAFVYDDEIEASMMEGMTNTINNTYGQTEAATASVNSLQEQFNCCGASGYEDYQTSLYIYEEYPGASVPDSCCKLQTEAGLILCQAGTKGAPADTDLVWDVGCVEASIDTVKDNFILLGALCFGLIVFEVLTMVFTCCVIDGIQKKA